MRTASYHCPHCDAFLWFLSLKPPLSEKVDCRRCNKPYLLTARALRDAWCHSFAIWGLLVGTLIFGLGSLFRLEFVGILMAPMLGLGVAFLLYVLGIPIGHLAASTILSKSSGNAGIKSVEMQTYDE